jgi:hypothetical protein
LEYIRLKSNILLEEYKILVDFLKFHHRRRQTFETTFLTINTILVSGIAYILKSATLETKIFLIPICIIGVIVSMVWLCIGERIAIDGNLKYFQLRCVERKLNCSGGILITGHNFFFGKKDIKSTDGQDNIKYPEGIIRRLISFRVVWTDRFLSIVFICLFLGLLTYKMFFL